MILNDPDLPDGTMTQLSPDLVAIGTGGQGEFQVQVGNPSDVGYPLITNVPPVPEASTAAVQRTGGQALVINPATTGATFNFVIDQTPYTLKAGQSQPLAGRPSWVIAFDRGGQFGQARYTLAPGHYELRCHCQRLGSRPEDLQGHPEQLGLPQRLQLRPGGPGRDGPGPPNAEDHQQAARRPDVRPRQRAHGGPQGTGGGDLHDRDRPPDEAAGSIPRPRAEESHDCTGIGGAICAHNDRGADAAVTVAIHHRPALSGAGRDR